MCAAIACGASEESNSLELRAEEAYRLGQYDLAITLWQDRLQELGEVQGTSNLRGGLCYNIGNALYRVDQPMHALAWYHAALRHLPRDGDLRANLDFVRGELGLDPIQGDGLGASWMGWLRSWTPAEARKMAWFGVALLGLALVWEALRGGRWARRGVALAACAMVLLWLPWLRGLWATGDPTAMVVSERGASGRSEPRTSARSLVGLDAAETVYPIDAWQDWVKVRTREGKEVWLDQEKVLSTWR